MLPGMVPANDNHDSQARDVLKLALSLWPLWAPPLLVGLAVGVMVAWVVG
jgi:hypothetical protein